MYFSAHLAVGTAIGSVTASPWVAAAAGLTSHAVLDMIGHHDYDGAKGGLVDLLAGLALLGILRWVFLRFGATDSSLLAGAIAATIPDLEVVISFLTNRRWRLIFPTHSGLLPHPHRPLPWGALVQVLVAGASLTLALIIRAF